MHAPSQKTCQIKEKMPTEAYNFYLRISRIKQKIFKLFHRELKGPSTNNLKLRMAF